MQLNFNACLAEVRLHEGGYVDHPADPGGATNMGITLATLARWRGQQVTKGDVRSLTLGEAAAIFRAYYWAPVRGDDLPVGLDLVAFDAAVNSGPVRAVKWLQAGLRVKVDGVIGPLTLVRASSTSDLSAVVRKACAARMGFLRGLKIWSSFGRGWSKRVAQVEARAISMILSGGAKLMLLEANHARRDAATDRKAAAGSGAAGASGGYSVEAFWDAPVDMSLWIWAAVIGLTLMAVINFAGRARHNLERARAFERLHVIGGDSDG